MNWSNIFDYVDGELFWKIHANNNVPKGSLAGTIRNDNYVGVYYLGKYYFAHKIIYEMFNGPLPDGLIVDHKDRNTLNNLKENLRAVTYSQNSMNKRGNKIATSDYKGVSWHKQKGKWVSAIKINGSHKHLGFFHEEYLAALAYDTAAKANHGEYAFLNFPSLT